ncbi:MAG: hypothetical protein ABR501_12340 [Pyrinomonadaceae bacterium]
MKVVNPRGMRFLYRLLSLAVVLIAISLVASAQATKPQEVRDTPVPGPVRTNADETFELNIDERRFTQENFKASTSVGTDGDTGLNLQVGVGLAADRIEVLLRNVRGSVRFRGTVDRVLEMIGSRRVLSPPSSPK